MFDYNKCYDNFLRDISKRENNGVEDRINTLLCQIVDERLVKNKFTQSVTLEQLINLNEKGIEYTIIDDNNKAEVLYCIIVDPIKDNDISYQILSVYDNKQIDSYLFHKLPKESKYDYMLLSISNNGIYMINAVKGKNSVKCFESFFDEQTSMLLRDSLQHSDSLARLDEFGIESDIEFGINGSEFSDLGSLIDYFYDSAKCLSGIDFTLHLNHNIKNL